jgi:8-oxo-dGTP pyrophosphatase MutT (NUDIX family)
MSESNSAGRVVFLSSAEKVDTMVYPYGESFIEQAGGIVVWGDKVVLRCTDKHNLVLPKGHIEAGETAIDAAVREVEEETGLVAEPIESVGSVVMHEDHADRRIHFYLMQVRNETPAWSGHCGTDAFPVPIAWAESLLKHEQTRMLFADVRPRIERFAQPI